MNSPTDALKCRQAGAGFHRDSMGRASSLTWFLVCGAVLALMSTCASPPAESLPPATTLVASTAAIDPEAIARVDAMLAQMAQDGTFLSC